MTTIPLTVSQLNRQIRNWLEQDVGAVSVSGELSNLSKPASGHFYFTLKDDSAQVRCVFFRNHHTKESRQFTNGQQVIAKGSLSLYEARGDYQLIVQDIVPAGIGNLYQQFEQLKLKLQQQGLFAEHRKKPLQRYPAHIAIITSQSGAALQDMLTTLARRFPLADVHVYPCEVQGKQAAIQLAKAILQANADNCAQVILLARGGGSMEDLWPFNDENLALTISQSRIPLVSGVGHETDFTIADFVADLRAATPTAAAQAATPDKFELLALIAHFQERLSNAMTSVLQHNQLMLKHHINRLLSPEQIIFKHWQTLDYLERQLHQNWQRTDQQRCHKLQMLVMQLEANSPVTILTHYRQQTTQLINYLHQRMAEQLRRSRGALDKQLGTLHTVSPLATLNRGYAIATQGKTVLFRSDQVKSGELIKVRLAEGSLTCRVIEA